ncbi:hypothetical protein [Pontibacter sp. H249]|uniref:hypothetical protein n=1 Tax=Pontibacter sp. H249 TaxID=3133420 RepID=UPI0030BBAEAF
MAIYRSGQRPSTPAAEGIVLTQEQDELLDLYIQELDSFYEELRQAEKTAIAIETTHLKRMLTKKRT